MFKREHWVWIAFLLVLGAVLYGNSLKTPFLWDEDALITHEPRVHTWLFFPEIFTKPFLTRSPGFALYYRPLITLSFRIDHMFWGFNPFGYHLTNLLFHLLNTLLVYLLFVRFFRNRTLSFFGAFLFLAHPAHVEAVTYIPGRVDLIAFFFYLSAFYFYLLARASEKRALPYSLSLLCCALALLSKEMAVTLPLVILAHAFWVGSKERKLKRSDIIFFLGLFWVMALWFFVRRLVTVPVPFDLLLDFPRLPLRLMVLPKVVALYLRIWFFPWPLHMDHMVPIDILNVKGLAMEWGLFLGCILGMLVMLRKPLERFWLFWAGIALTPALQFVPLYLFKDKLFISEHFLYFSSVGVIALLASRLGPFIVTQKQGADSLGYPAAAGLLGAILTSFCFLVISRNGDYRDQLTFFEQTARHAPWSYRAYSELGVAYRRVGDFKHAEEAIRKALVLNPTDGYAYINYGVLADDQGKSQEAEARYTKALQLSLEGIEKGAAYFNLGAVRASQRRWQEAVQFYEKAIAVDPAGIMQAYVNIAYAYWELGEKEKALQSLERGLKVDPSNERLKIFKARVETRLGKENSVMAGGVLE